MAPAFWSAFIQLFRKSGYTSVPRDPDPHPPTSSQDGDDSTQDGPQAADPSPSPSTLDDDGNDSTHDGAHASDTDPNASPRDDDDNEPDRNAPSPPNPSSLLRFFNFSHFLNTSVPKATSLSDAALINATAAIRALVTRFKQYVDWIKQNPRQTALIAACIIIPILFAACTPAILGAVGFSAAGPVAGMYMLSLSYGRVKLLMFGNVGSLAAALQAHIGIVGAGSLFAIVQSAAMAGYGLPIVLPVVWGGMSAVCWGARALWKKFTKGHGDGSDGDDRETGSMVVVR
jgi:hypothetical protein